MPVNLNSYFRDLNLNHLFPFHILFNRKFKILSVGSSLNKVVHIDNKSNIKVHFEFLRPNFLEWNPVLLKESCNQVFVLNAINVKDLKLRGQVISLKKDTFLFLGSPWITDSDSLEKLNLNLLDFSLHDSTADMIQYIKVMQLANQDIENLADELKNKKGELIQSYSDINKKNQQLLTLINNIQAGLLLENEDRKILMVNKEFCNIFNINIAPEILIGTDCSTSAYDTMHLFKDPDIFVKKIEQLLQEMKPSYHDQIEMANGIVLDRSFVPINNNSNNHGHLWIYRDITLEIKEQNMLFAAKERVLGILDAKENFVSNISHELSTPINIISSVSELLLNTELSETQKDYTDIIKATSSSLVKLVNEILEYEKIESKKININIAKFDPRVLIQRIFKNFSFQSHEKNIELIINIDESVPDFISFDSLRLEQILVNLMSNAIKFTHNGSVTFNLFYRKAQTNNKILFTLTDTGLGISTEELKHLFDRYWQSKKNSSNVIGSGLGLPIVKSIIDIFQGSIEVESIPNKGTKFTVEIPTYDFSQSQTPLSISNVYRNLNELKGVKLLLAEDNPIIQMIIKKVLGDCGIEVTTVDDGIKVIEILNKSTFNVLLIDLQMPVMDGYETIHHIRNSLVPHISSLPILIISANSTGDINTNFRYLNVQGFIPKPFSHEKLINVIYDVVVAKKQRRQYCDFEYLKSIDKMDTDFYYQILQQIVHQIPSQLKDLKEKIVNNDIDGVKKAIHKFKSTINYLGATEQLDKLNKIKNDIIEGKWVDAESDLVVDFFEVMDNIVFECENELKSGIRLKNKV